MDRTIVKIRGRVESVVSYEEEGVIRHRAKFNIPCDDPFGETVSVVVSEHEANAIRSRIGKTVLLSVEDA